MECKPLETDPLEVLAEYRVSYEIEGLTGFQVFSLGMWRRVQAAAILSDYLSGEGAGLGIAVSESYLTVCSDLVRLPSKSLPAVPWSIHTGMFLGGPYAGIPTLSDELAGNLY